MPFAVRARFAWRLRTRTLELGRRTLLMGILNVTPDSFSDGGEWLDADRAVGHGLAMLDAGADIVDLGGESTRPGAAAVAPAEEQARVLPVLRAILRARPEAVLSIDTYRAETARMAVEAGAEIVNDVSGHLWDAGMGAACAALGSGAVLMHTRGRPREWRGLPRLAPGEVVPLAARELAARAREAMAAGVAREAIVLDPGFGFGKAGADNFSLLAGLEELGALGFPVLAGVSRKGFLGRALAPIGNAGGPFDDVGGPSFAVSSQRVGSTTTAANTAAILAGAHILRVHDVGEARAAAAIADRVLGALEA
jgi:dihydropteroate synthase